MEAETIEALKASIAKWKRNAEAAIPAEYRTGELDCPLCAIFSSYYCKGCPVQQASGQTGCRGTPYIAAYDAWFDWFWDTDSAKYRALAHEAARAEVAFLESLLPEGET